MEIMADSKDSTTAVYNIEAKNSNVIVGDYTTINIVQPKGNIVNFHDATVAFTVSVYKKSIAKVLNYFSNLN